MAMRMSGLMSGMDTESIVQQLVEARSTKVTKAKNSQTKLQWKQDIWKDLNTKLKTLQSKLSGLRFSSDYAKKITKASNSNAVSVLTSDSAVNGVQQLQINQLAKTAYMTGGKILTRDEKINTDAIKAGDVLTFDQDGDGKDIPKTFKMTITTTDPKTHDVTDTKEVNFSVTSETTATELIKQLRDAGLEAIYDDETGKIRFLPAKNTNVSLEGDSSVYSALMEPGSRKDTGSEVTALTELGDLMIFSRDGDGNEISKSIKVKTGEKEVNIELTSKTTISDMLTKMREAGLNANFDAKQERFFISAKDSGADGNFTITSNDADAMEALGLAEKKDTDEKGNEINVGVTYITGQDARITLNGATFTNKNNTFEINGLTIVAQNETQAGETITLTTQQDTDGIYDKIKDFFKTYNEVINEIDKLYNADSAKDYEPLSDDEKYSMSDSEIEKYEQKIKDSLLRRDENLSSVGNALKKIMLKGFSVNGKTMYLSNFGIETLSYFTASDNERSAYHIDGDPDDTNTSGNTDKLKQMIASDPDTVISFFTQLTQSLYTEMNEQSKSVEGTRSFGSFYDDKKMKSDYDDYKTKIKDLEDKLADYEDKWYKKFAAMETAMAKMQQNASAVTGLLGGNS
ncbi:MAG: flagellar filament capping protein FliD [bacterium]|nr:flagellar filament capping protein FliD [bacterium]